MDTARKGSVGRLDRSLRLILGAVALGFALLCPWAAALGPGVQLVSGAVGVVLVATAAVRFCPLYRLLGICTA